MFHPFNDEIVYCFKIKSKVALNWMLNRLLNPNNVFIHPGRTWKKSEYSRKKIWMISEKVWVLPVKVTVLSVRRSFSARWTKFDCSRKKFERPQIRCSNAIYIWKSVSALGKSTVSGMLNQFRFHIVAEGAWGKYWPAVSPVLTTVPGPFPSWSPHSQWGPLRTRVPTGGGLGYSCEGKRHDGYCYKNDTFLLGLMLGCFS